MSEGLPPNVPPGPEPPPGIVPPLPTPLPPPLPKSRPKPVSETDRFQSLDVVRGLALFGILFVNIQDFAMVPGARYHPMVSGGRGLANELIWLGTFHLADTKFIAIFTLLFGAGIALANRRRRERRERRALAYYRRMLFLLILGFLHGLLLWRGDILYFYAFWGLALYFAPRLPTPILFTVGILFVGVYSLKSGYSMLDMRPMYSWTHLHILSGDWIGQFKWRLESLPIYTGVLPRVYAFDILGLMLIGMGMLKCGFLEGRFRTRIYVALFLMAAPGGLLLIYMGTGLQPGFESFMHTEAFFWGSAYLSLAYIAGGISLSKLASTAMPVRAIASVGRMALTNYLMHSVICTTIFYGYGLGYYEELDRRAQLGIVLGIGLMQLGLSSLWLRAFLYGPMEWLWRSATYWRWQALRRPRPQTVGEPDEMV